MSSFIWQIYPILVWNVRKCGRLYQVVIPLIVMRAYYFHSNLISLIPSAVRYSLNLFNYSNRGAR